MFDDSFKSRYRLAPIAISDKYHFRDTVLHIHNEVELLYIMSGNAEVRIADRVFAVSAGDFVMVNPLEMHSIHIDRSVPYHERCICFDTSLITDRTVGDAVSGGSMRVPPYFPADSEITARLIECFCHLYRAVEECGAALYLESSAYISLIFAELMKKSMLQKTADTDKNAKFCRKVIDYLSAHFHEPITSRYPAEEFFYTQSYFCRVFRENFGIPFSIYLCMYRISAAKLMLEDKYCSIADVAMACGFTDTAYFAKCFRKYVGLSPSEYQKCQYSY